MNRLHKHIFWIVIGLAVSQCLLGAQRRDATLNQFRLARQYENSGQIEKAAELYFQLNHRDPSNPTFFGGLKRTYLHLRRFDELIEIIREQLQRRPSDVQLRAELGNVYFRSGQEKLAYDIWEQLQQDFPRRLTVYRLVANVMFTNHLFDRGIEVYLRGRKIVGDETSFALELARLYTLQQNYRQATEEYLRLLNQNPAQLKYVERNLASFPGEAAVYHDVVNEIKKWTREHPQTLAFRSLLISYYLSYSNYRDALREVIELERLHKLGGSKIPSGSELFKFAQDCYKDGAYTFAVQAFLEILKSHPKFPRIGDVKVRLANTYLQENNLQQALVCFEKVAQDYPKTRWALQAYLTIGTIALEHFFDLDRAITSFQQVLQQFPRHDERVEALFKLGDCWVAKKDLNQAETCYRQALDTSIRNSKLQTDIRDQARLKLAELEFYRGNFDKAKEYLGQIVSLGGDFDKPYVNDALELSFLIDNDQKSPEALRLFALADQQKRARQYTEATELLQEILERFPSASLVERARFQLGELEELRTNYSDAISLYQTLIKSYPQGTLGDLALSRIGRIYEQQFKDINKAKIAYEQVLIQYPDSLLAEEMRKKIRNLEER